MKKSIGLVAFLAISMYQQTMQAQQSFTIASRLTDSQKIEMSHRVRKIINKDRLKLAIEGTALLGAVLALYVLPMPKIFERGGSFNLSISNPDGKFFIKLFNFGCLVVQHTSTGLFLDFLKKHIFSSFTSGQWGFTLLEFKKKHTRLPTAFESVNTQISILLHESNRNMSIQYVESLLIKIQTLAECLGYIDGYVLLKIKELDNDSKFNAKEKLSKEYAFFEITRKRFIEDLLVGVDNLKIKTESGDFQNKVMHLINTFRHGSHNLNNCIESLNLCE